MKTFTSLLKKATLVLLLFTSFCCSVEPIDSEQSLVNQPENLTSFNCSGEQPEARFVNNGSVSFTFSIISEDSGQVAQFIDVAPGTSTNWTSFSSGNVLFSIDSNTSGVSDIKTQLAMQNCESFELVVQSDNTLSSTTL